MILIVDDKAENIFSLQRTLEMHSFEVDSANSGEEALKKILNTDYSLIILDVQMPGMDGFEVAETISGYSKSKDIPIIFLSAVNTDKKFIAKGYTAGGVDYVTKPVDADIFMLKVKTLHRLYEQNRELNRIQSSLLQEVQTRKEAEQQLTKTMQEQRSILESMPQIAFTLKPNGELEFVNEQWYVYSNSDKQMPGFDPGDDEVAAKIVKTVGEGKSLTAEVRIKNLVSDSYRWHLLKLMPIRQGDAISKWVGTFTDIHDQKAANETLEAKVQQRTEELIAKNKELEASNHELQQFASVASHDLKEPLRKIQIFSTIVRDRHLNGSDQAEDNMGRIIEASQRMTGLINDLLNYSRLSIDTLFEEVDLKQTISEIVKDLEFTIDDKKATIIISDLPRIQAVPGQMRQVFQNLLSNSLKFARPELRPEIQISGVILPGDMCRITVKDNGIGFDEQYLDRIFTIFQRLNARESYEGTGIGLAIVKKIIEKHGGTITAKSQPGDGAAFIIELPMHQNSFKTNFIQTIHNNE
ncbi:MAG: response regulator [Bacteroidetes bacterium]|nr:response regulator [Bacteroidota bacterium]